MNTVEALLQVPFSTRSLADKLQIKEMGPHRPKLQIQEVTMDRGMQYTRRFSEDWYQKKQWLCGSIPKEALFCFPCLLFGGEKLWTQTGVKDLKDFTQKVNEHEASKMHCDNLLRFCVLGKTNIGSELDEGSSIRKHNQEVDSNRFILSRLIDCVRFCGLVEIAVQHCDESESSNNPGVFGGVIDLLASMDTAMQQHLQQATVFRSMSKNIQSKLLDCMLTVARNHIKEELQSASFVAIEVDDASVPDICQNALIFRYIAKDGKPVERFYDFIQGAQAETIATALLQHLEEIFPEHADKDKLIAQSYDGASRMRGEQGGVPHRIREVFCNAHYVHSFTHQLNHVVEKVAAHVQDAKFFIADLFAFREFFSNNTRRTIIHDKIIRAGLTTAVSPHWNFSIGTVGLIYEKREELIEYFEAISNLQFDDVTTRECSKLLRILEDQEFLYWLSFFHQIMPHVDILNCQLQGRRTDPDAAGTAIRDFVDAIAMVRGSVGALFPKLPPQTTSWRRLSKETMDCRALEVCDTIISCTQERFAFSRHLSSARLLDPSLYPAHNKSFPEDTLDEIVQAYPMLEKGRLRTELSTIYVRQELYTAKSALEILQLLMENDVHKNFPQLVMLLKISITTPLTIPEEQNFSALKRLKSFLRNTVHEEQLNALAMLCIERQMINNIPDFSQKVIEVFAAQEEHQAYFMYKK